MFTISMILQSPPVLVSFSEEVLVHMLEMDPKVVETQVIILNVIIAIMATTYGIYEQFQLGLY